MAHSEPLGREKRPYMSRSKLLTAKQVAAMVAVHPNLVYLALSDGELQGRRVGRGPKAPWRIRIEDVENWLVQPTPAS